MIGQTPPEIVQKTRTRRIYRLGLSHAAADRLGHRFNVTVDPSGQ